MRTCCTPPIFSQIRTVFEPIQGPCTMNVRNEPLHDMACVVKCKTPPEWRWKLCEFQHKKKIVLRWRMSIMEEGSSTGWRRPIGCLIFIGHFLHKSPMISGSSAERDLQLQASYGSLPPCPKDVLLCGRVHSMSAPYVMKKRALL